MLDKVASGKSRRVAVFLVGVGDFGGDVVRDDEGILMPSEQIHSIDS